MTIVGCGLVKRGRLGFRHLEEGELLPAEYAPVSGNDLPANVEPGTVRTFVLGTHLTTAGLTTDDDDPQWPRLTPEGSTTPIDAEAWVRTSSGYVYRSTADRA